MIFDTEIAIIVSAIPERQRLLQRSLETWRRSAMASDQNVSIYINLEGHDDEWDLSLLHGASLFINRQIERSGSHIAGYNIGIQAVKANTYIFTHPEMLFPQSAIQAAIQTVGENMSAHFKCFWMPQELTENLSNYYWLNPEKMELDDKLYSLDKQEKGPTYSNMNVRNLTTWESTTTVAVNHQTLWRFAPFVDFGQWGPDDPYLMLVRRRLGIRTVTIQDPILFHQYHELQTPTQEMAREALFAADGRFPQIV